MNTDEVPKAEGKISSSGYNLEEGRPVGDTAPGKVNDVEFPELTNETSWPGSNSVEEQAGGVISIDLMAIEEEPERHGQNFVPNSSTKSCQTTGLVSSETMTSDEVPKPRGEIFSAGSYFKACLDSKVTGPEIMTSNEVLEPHGEASGQGAKSEEYLAGGEISTKIMVNDEVSEPQSESFKPGLNSEDSNASGLMDVEKLDLNSNDGHKLESWIPRLGMEFDSAEEAYDFYGRYGGILGFNIRRNRIRRGRKREIFFRSYCCSKEGSSKVKNEGSRRREDRRTGCSAILSIRKEESGKWSVIQFVQEHNHEFAKLLQTPIVRLEPKLEENVVIVNDTGAKIERRPIIGAVQDDQLKSKRSAIRKALEAGDVAAVLGYLRTKRADDPSFVYEIQHDEDFKIKNFFWADARSTTDYHYFGDVVCFDSTCKPNSKDRPFGVFTGINHHKRTVVFGAALLYDETAPSFEWLFTTFVKAMGGKLPKTMLTDRGKLIANAVASALPNVHHRTCVWHVYQSALQNIANVFNRLIDGKRQFVNDFEKCIYSCREEEFLTEWQSMLEKYGLGENLWLSEIFEERENWSLAYGRHSFYGDIKSAQQREKLNRSLKTSLETEENFFQFFQHYEKVLAAQRSNELQGDFKASQTNLKPTVPSPVLEKATNVYTLAAFKTFQEEYVHICNNRVVETFSDGSLKISKVRTIIDNHGDHEVKFDVSNKAVECSCKKFEVDGFLCRHAFTVLHHEGILELPSPYIMHRWTKDAKAENVVYDHGSALQLDSKVEKARRKDYLFCTLRKVSVEAVEYEESYKLALAYLDMMLQDVRRSKYGLDFQMLEENASHDMDTADKIMAPCDEGSKKRKLEMISCSENGEEQHYQLQDRVKDPLDDGNYLVASEVTPCNIVSQQVASIEATPPNNLLITSSPQVNQLISGMYSTAVQCSNSNSYHYMSS